MSFSWAIAGLICILNIKLDDVLIQFKQNKVVWAFYALNILSLLSLLWGPGLNHQVLHLCKKHVLLLSLILFATFFYCHAEYLWPRLIKVFYISAILITIINYLHWFGLVSHLPFQHHVLNDFYFFSGKLDTSSILAIVSLALVYYLLEYVVSLSMRVAYLFVAVFIVSGVFMSGSLTAAVVFVVGTIFAIFKLQSRRQKFWLLIAMLFALVTLCFTPPMQQRLATMRSALHQVHQLSQKQVTSTGIRMHEMYLSLELIKARPFFGHGLGGYMDAFKGQRLSQAPEDSEDTYTMTLVQFGVVGFAILIYLLWQLYRYSLQLDGIKRFTLQLLILETMVYSFSQDVFYNMKFGVFFSITSLLLVALAMKQKQHINT